MDTDSSPPFAASAWVVTAVTPQGGQLYRIDVVSPDGVPHSVLMSEMYVSLVNVRLAANVVSMLWRDTVGATPLALDR